MKRRMRAEQRHQKKISKLKHLKRQKEEMRMEEERERKNQEAMREWRRAKAQKAREQESRRREDKRRRKAKRKQKYVRFVRLPSISLKGAAPPEPHFARETFAGATASYGAGAGAARDDRRPHYPTPAQMRANAAEALLAVGRQQRRRFKDPYVRRKHSKKR